MSTITLVLKSASQSVTISQRDIASFVLEKEIYTPYSTLSGIAYGDYTIDQLKDVYRIQLLADDTILHLGTVEQLRVEKQKGVTAVKFTSKGLTAMLLQNQLEPGLHSGISLDDIMTEYVTFPDEITWESSTDKSNYLYVKENTSMWDGIANLTYKLHKRYPFVANANEIRMNPLDSYHIYAANDEQLLGAGMISDHSRIYSDYYMADVDGTYGAFHENEPEATARGIVRSKQLSLDRQYLYDPQEALAFRRKFADRGLIRYYTDWKGVMAVTLGDKLSYGDVLHGAVITHIRMSGNQNGIRTRLECYKDAFYNYLQ